MSNVQSTMKTKFEVQSGRLITWCKERALPFWAENGVDPKGGFFEALNYDGSACKSSLRRVRVQSRQSYVYALASHLGWYDNAKGISDHGWFYIMSKGLSGGEHISLNQFIGCAHLLNADGSVNDGLRDTYAQAFLMLAASWRYKAFSDQMALDVLYATNGFLEKRMRSSFGGWIEGLPNSLPRRQNPHMHLFEAFLTAYEATADKVFLRQADEIFSLFTTHFFDKESKTLLEYFQKDWTPCHQTGLLTEPGHMMEWSWLLNWYADLTEKSARSYAETLYQKAILLGLNDRTGLLINEVSIYGKPTNSNSRCWPQTEFIKASIARAHSGHLDGFDQAADMIENLFHYFLEPPMKGGWHDERLATGELNISNMPASTFYHIICAASEANTAISKLFSPCRRFDRA